MYSLLREYPWLRPYWYATLAILALFGVLMILWDGKTQVDKGRRRAARLQQKQRQQRLAAQDGTGTEASVVVDAGGSETVAEGGGTQQRRPPRKTSVVTLARAGSNKYEAMYPAH